MRRMYSVQELSEIVSVVIGEKIEDGSFDEVIAGAVDDYLTEHPVDITALEGLDISVGSLDADGLVTGAEIVEKMSGYSYTATSKENVTLTISYAGVVKNGNKITFACAGTFKRTDDITGWNCPIAKFNIPASIGAKLYESTIGGTTALAFSQMYLASGYASGKVVPCLTIKNSDTQIQVNFYSLTEAVVNTDYLFRYEITFLLSDNLAS